MFLNKVEICGVNTSELPLLSDEEKENLFIQIEQGNMDAREQYVKGNLRLVLSVIQRFSSNHEHADDLFQVGCIGLMKAIDNFDRTFYLRRITDEKITRDDFCLVTCFGLCSIAKSYGNVNSNQVSENGS